MKKIKLLVQLEDIDGLRKGDIVELATDVATEMIELEQAEDVNTEKPKKGK